MRCCQELIRYLFEISAGFSVGSQKVKSGKRREKSEGRKIPDLLKFKGGVMNDEKLDISNIREEITNLEKEIDNLIKKIHHDISEFENDFEFSILKLKLLVGESCDSNDSLIGVGSGFCNKCYKREHGDNPCAPKMIKIGKLS